MGRKPRSRQIVGLGLGLGIGFGKEGVMVGQEWCVNSRRGDDVDVEVEV